MKVINYLWFLACAVGFSQTVTVNDTDNSPSNLVDLLLDNACVQVSGVEVSSSEAVAYFNNNSGAFPISEGVIIRSGKAKFSEGSYTGNNLSSQLNTNSDADLQAINNASGQSAAISDVGYLQFDFTPLSDNFNFNFLFASNEYGEWQCVSSDVFAFILTDLTTGETQNLAVIPDTDIPVSVRNIKDNTYNSSCESTYADLFASYQVNNPSSSTINMRGYTNMMTASADIVPGNSYRIKLVIGDSNDADYDSAIFLSAGSFDANINLGEDRVVCGGDTETFSTGLNTAEYSHTWTKDGELIAGETGNSLVVSEIGTYGVTVSKNNSSCVVSDEVVVSNLQVGTPEDLGACYSEDQIYFYDLTRNNAASLELNPEEFEVVYYASQEDLTGNIAIPSASITEYSSAGNETIFFKIKNLATGNFCDAIYDFQLLVSAPMIVNYDQVIEFCATAESHTYVNLTLIVDQIVEQSSSNTEFGYQYFHSQANAQDSINQIHNPYNFAIVSTTDTLTRWIRVSDPAISDCFKVLSFDIALIQPPQVDELEDVVECNSYTLPSLVNGNYFSQSGGTGTALFEGDVIDESGTIYIYNVSEVGCVNESSFQITLLDEFELDPTYCGEFTVPQNPLGGFYTATGGPDGVGQELSPGTILTSSQTIYFYTEVGGSFCTDKPFYIEIIPLPEIDTPAPVITCGSYTLPALSHGNYYTQPSGGGDQLNAGYVVNSNRTLYIYSSNDTCTNQHALPITITPVFEDLMVCGSYTLPNLHVGGYYTQPNGGGDNLPEGTNITSSQTIYYFAETTTSPNCTQNISFEIEIVPLPEVDELNDVVLCDGEFFVLPTLINGQYFTAANRGGTELFAGETIGETTTIYINSIENECTNETSFDVEIRPIPLVENFTDVYSCEPYELPVLTHGNYYTQPGGNGQMLDAGYMVNNTRTIYIYNQYEDLTYCSNEDAFTVYIEQITLGNFPDVSSCGSFMLPTLSKGKYYTESGGQGTVMFPGDVITESQEIFVYHSIGTRFMCEAEKSFSVTITEMPEIDYYENIASCGSYTLPDLSQDEYNISYHWESGGESAILNPEKTISTPGTYTIYVYATAKENNNCTAEEQFQLTINPLRDLNIEGGVICKDPATGETLSPVILKSGLDSNEFDVEWYLNSTLVHIGSDFEATQAGIYTVKTVKLDPNDGTNCDYNPTTVEVLESGISIISAKVTEPFENIASINVKIEKGFGDYEYQLNGGQFQDDNEFYDVPSGFHTITVRGKNGDCGKSVITVQVLKYPKFFTPNGDGINDTWNITDLKDHPEAKIYMHDRYGKLLFILSPNGNGWDGQFHGRQMPSNDYWFRATFVKDGTEREFKANVTLKR